MGHSGPFACWPHACQVLRTCSLRFRPLVSLLFEIARHCNRIDWLQDFVRQCFESPSAAGWRPNRFARRSRPSRTACAVAWCATGQAASGAGSACGPRCGPGWQRRRRSARRAEASMARHARVVRSAAGVDVDQDVSGRASTLLTANALCRQRGVPVPGDAASVAPDVGGRSRRPGPRYTWHRSNHR